MLTPSLPHQSSLKPHNPNALVVPNVLVLDTCVLMHTIQRQLILRLAKHGITIPIWGEQIGIEWIRNAPRIWKMETDFVLNQWQQMQEDFPDSNMGIVSDYEQGLNHSDRKDWHVVACARAAQQRYAYQSYAVLTWNTKDFHRRELRQLGISLYTPDQYLALLWPQHQALMQDLFKLTLTDHLAAGKPEEPLTNLFKRDHLFRLNKLFLAQTSRD